MCAATTPPVPPAKSLGAAVQRLVLWVRGNSPAPGIAPGLLLAIVMRGTSAPPVPLAVPPCVVVCTGSNTVQSRFRKQGCRRNQTRVTSAVSMHVNATPAVSLTVLLFAVIPTFVLCGMDSMQLCPALYHAAKPALHTFLRPFAASCSPSSPSTNPSKYRSSANASVGPGEGG